MPTSKPDFSGEYVLNRAASTLMSGAVAIERGIVRIEHHEPVFRYAAAFVAGDRTLEYTFELVADGPAAAPDGSDASRLYWDGDALVTEHRDPAMTMWWRYELLDEGRQLRASETLRGRGQDQDNVWVFERR